MDILNLFPVIRRFSNVKRRREIMRIIVERLDVQALKTLEQIKQKTLYC